MAVLPKPRIAALRPGLSPPAVRIPTRCALGCAMTSPVPASTTLQCGRACPSRTHEVADAGGVLSSVCWVAFKVGALSCSGGFVIIPLMQADVVQHHHWASAGQFLNAVALGPVTPGPVVITDAARRPCRGRPGRRPPRRRRGLAPSFAFILLGAQRFDRLRGDGRARSFLDGAGPTAICAILGSAVPLARDLTQPWQLAVLAGALILLLALRRGVVATLLTAAAAGILLTTAGAPLPH